MTIQDLLKTLAEYPLTTEVVMSCGNGVYYTPIRSYLNSNGELVLDSEKLYVYTQR